MVFDTRCCFTTGLIQLSVKPVLTPNCIPILHIITEHMCVTKGWCSKAALTGDPGHDIRYKIPSLFLKPPHGRMLHLSNTIFINVSLFAYVIYSQFVPHCYPLELSQKLHNEVFDRDRAQERHAMVSPTKIQAMSHERHFFL